MKKIVWKFFGAFAALVLMVIFILYFFVSLKLSDNFEQKISEGLKSNAIIVGEILREDLLNNQMSEIQSKVNTLPYVY